MLWLLAIGCGQQQQQVPTPDTAPPPTEICTDGSDNDGDGLVDCDDPDCRATCPEDCADGLDNDLDGLLDCADPDCEEACTETCDDEIDNDQDSKVDCLDPDCEGDPACAEDCQDDVDNDLDGETDCWDSDCDDHQACIEVCDDGVDNDEDGRLDCEDSECSGLLDPCIEICDDGIDNDEDGQSDCADSECSGVADHCIEACDDGVDNDEDGSTDCYDSECAGWVEPCIELCSDGVDNDLDGRVDCEDGDCASSCTELDCSDGLDEDGDSRTDCEDSDCWGVDECPGRASIRILGGTSSKTPAYAFSSGYTKWETGRIAQDLYGTALFQDDEQSLTCDWSASRLGFFQGRLTLTDYTWETISSTTFVHTHHTRYRSQAIWPSGMTSTGACGGLITDETVGFSNKTLQSSFEQRVEFPGTGRVYMDGVPFLVQRTNSGPIIGAWTEPWVFWEEE